MRRTLFTVFICVAMIWVIGCGSQNEYLSKGKEWVKSDKRGKIAKAVAQFELAIEKEPQNAEAHYLLGYYDENATIERRTEQMVLAYKNDKRKYLKILIEEALRDRDDNIRKSAIKALQDVNANIDPMIKPLVKSLKSKDSRDRDDAALVLSKLSNRREVVDRLMQEDIIKHKRMGTRFDAVRALGDIGDPVAINALMDRITTLKTKDEKGEEAEVRRAAVIALKQISKRKIEIDGDNGQSPILDIQVTSSDDGVKINQDITGELAKKITLQKDEIIYSVINNKKVKSLEEFNQLVNEAIGNKIVTFGIPKIVKIRAAKLDDIGIVWGDSKDNGLIVKNLTIDGKAGKLGIEKGETIAYVNNQPVKTAQDYERIVNETIAKGEEIRFTIADDDKYKTVSVSVPDVEIAQIQEQVDKEKSSEANKNKPIVKEFKKEAKKEPQVKQQADQKPQIPIGDVIQIAILGIAVQALPNGTEGVIITDLRPQSPAVEAGLRLGQIISYVVNEKKIQNVEQFKQFVRDGLDDGKVTITAINKTAISKLIEVLRNKGLIVRFDAAMALGELRDKAAVDSLINMLQEETSPIEIKL
jgi:C-terminal processing protease CtpA/Prc